MNAIFAIPVTVSTDWETHQEIRSLMDMHRFLQDWPPSRQTSTYSTAVRACEAARLGHLTPEQAKRAFISFAKCHHILAAEIETFMADGWARPGRSGSTTDAASDLRRRDTSYEDTGSHPR